MDKCEIDRATLKKVSHLLTGLQNLHMHPNLESRSMMMECITEEAPILRERIEKVLMETT
tara:strand:+ start:742 stop:921 length:180 start_codon:yes stop_codon:yes gene_type:complete